MVWCKLSNLQVWQPVAAGYYPQPFSADPIWTPPPQKSKGEFLKGKFCEPTPKKKIFSIIRPYSYNNFDANISRFSTLF